MEGLANRVGRAVVLRPPVARPAVRRPRPLRPVTPPITVEAIDRANQLARDSFKNGELGSQNQATNRSHEIFLSVEESALMEVASKNYGLVEVENNSLYAYNIAYVPIKMSETDKQAFTAVAEAFSNAEFDHEELKDVLDVPYLAIAFNAPRSEWDAAGPPPGVDDSGVEWALHTVPNRRADPRRRTLKKAKLRLQILRSDFLNRLYDIYGCSINVKIRGDLHHPNFRRGRRHPLSLTHEMIALNVQSNGETSEITTEFVPKLLGVRAVQGSFTILLSWSGPEPVWDPLPSFKDMMIEMSPALIASGNRGGSGLGGGGGRAGFLLGTSGSDSSSP